jgi:uncharacterized cofD-like protein
MKKKKVVVVGGGTGTHTVLRGLRHYSDELDITAIVSMADTGGSTGRLRDEFGLLPIGDVRNALTALAGESDEDELLLRQLFLYRFARGEGLSGHNFGNLFLTALTDILGSEEKAIEAAAKILRVEGRVLPVTTDDVQLVAEFSDGQVVLGQEEIEYAKAAAGESRIVSLWLTPAAALSPAAENALLEADLVVFGPGDLYTSILANCVVDGFVDTLHASKAKLVYVCNLMSKSGQTTGMHAAEHLAELIKHLGTQIDVAIVNTEPIDTELQALYEAEGDHPIINNCVGDTCLIVATPLLSGEPVIKQTGDIVKRSLVRHDSHKLAAAIKQVADTI